MPTARPILIDLPNQFVGERVLARQYIDEDAAALHATIEVSRAHLQHWLPGFNHERPLARPGRMGNHAICCCSRLPRRLRARTGQLALIFIASSAY